MKIVLKHVLSCVENILIFRFEFVFQITGFVRPGYVCAGMSFVVSPWVSVRPMCLFIFMIACLFVCLFVVFFI